MFSSPLPSRHSDIKHLYKLLECAKTAGVREAYIHCILDGEDAPNGK